MMEYKPLNRKRLPYGMMNFEDIRLDNYYYVDKTSFIPMIEDADRFFFFIRPRRFGKSLTLNTFRKIRWKGYAPQMEPWNSWISNTHQKDCCLNQMSIKRS